MLYQLEIMKRKKASKKREYFFKYIVSSPDLKKMFSSIDFVISGLKKKNPAHLYKLVGARCLADEVTFVYDNPLYHLFKKKKRNERH
jgi:hypothetical protein